jgi:hypothetical protein
MHYIRYFELLWTESRKQSNHLSPMCLLLQYRRPPPVDSSTLVGFLPFFPTPFGFGISELLSPAVAALLGDMMLAKDNDCVADGPA